jgi:Uma2 family endonuclease
MTAPSAPPVAIPPDLKRRFTVDEYYQMVPAGILKPDDRVELIEGEIVAMSPINPPHAGHVNQISNLLMARLAGRVVIATQNPVRLGQHSEPQPDVALLEPRSDFYARGHPTSDDVLLVIEVSDSTVDYDRDVKAPLYARSGIREMWLVNLNAGQVEVYRQPGTGGYAERLTLERGAEIAPAAFPDVSVPVDDLLGL